MALFITSLNSGSNGNCYYVGNQREAVLIDAGLQGMVRYDDDEEPTGKTSSDYVVAARHMEDFGKLVDDGNWTEVEKPKGIQPWTDDYSNMLTIVRWK